MKYQGLFKYLNNKTYFKTFVRSLMPYFIFLLALFFLFIIVYRRSESHVRAIELTKSEQTLQNAVQYFDNEFKNAYYNLISAAQDSNIQQLYSSYVRGEYKAYGKMLMAQKSLRAATNKTNIVIDSLLTVITPSEIVSIITSEYIIDDINRHLDMDLLYIDGLNPTQIITCYKNHDNDYMLADGFNDSMVIKIIQNDIRCIPYIVRLNSNLSLSGNVVGLYGMILLDCDEIINIMAPDNDGNIFYRISYNGEILYGSQNQANVESTNYKLLTTYSPTTRLEFSLSIPNEFLSRNLVYLSLFYKVCLITFIILCLLFVTVLVMSIFMPLSSLANRWDNTSLKKDIISSLSSGIDSLLSDNTILRQKIAAWRPVVKTEVIGRVLTGASISENELEVIDEISADAQSCFVIIVLSLSHNNQDIKPEARQLFFETMRFVISKFYPRSLIYPVDKNNFAVILNCEIDTSEIELREHVKNILSELLEMRMSFSAGIGSKVLSLDNIYLSYEKALEASYVSKRALPGTIAFYNEIKKQKQSYYFSYSTIEKLYNVLSSADYQSAVNILSQTIGQNKTNNTKLSNEDLTQLFYDLRGVVLRISSRVKIDNILEKLPRYHDEILFDEFLPFWESIFSQIAQKIAEQTGHNSLMNRILDYINANFTDNNISLKDVSSRFNITDKYLSALFKEKVVVNFSDYLENLRLSYAENLLLQTDKTINEISESVGYITPSTFYKAFKRKFGITPTNYLKLKESELHAK
ncbi:MAG: helix-turn-helix domain-containing protein [Oscillospiraceae bacterium]|nr:helix-turn-helix domain-containing protein [Oscillospiraceae bacterium]